MLSAGLPNSGIDRAVAVFDYGWTEEQAKGLFDSLNLTGGEVVRQSSNRRLE